MSNEILSHFIFAGGTIALMMAFMQFFQGRKEIRNIMLVIFFLVTALQQYQFFIIYQYMGGSGFISQQIFGLPKFIIGPVLYIYFCRLFDRKHRFTALSLFHLLPAILSVLHRILFLRFYLPVDFGLTAGVDVFRKIAFIIDFAGFILLLVYLFLIFKKIRLFSVLGSIDRTVARLSIFLVAFITLVIVLYVSTVFYASEALVKSSNFLTSFGIFLVFFFSQKYPEFLEWFRRELKEKSYKNSLLKGVDLDVIKKRLTELMEEEKIYYDDELTPKKLAEHLSISQHQLSELLNKHMDISFYNYISYYRIEEVKDLLMKNTEQSILSIAYSVGFNTKSSFYEAFSRLTGMTPLRYREEHVKSQKHR